MLDCAVGTSLSAQQRLRLPFASVCCYSLWAKRHDSSTLRSQMVLTKRMSGMVLKLFAVASLQPVVRLITWLRRMVVGRVSIPCSVITQVTMRALFLAVAPLTTILMR
jgi:hypothetical protein